MPNFITGNQTISGYLEQLAENVTTVSGQSIIDGVLYATTNGPSTRLVINTINNENVFGSSLRGQRARGVSGDLSGVLAGDVLLQMVGDGSYGSGFSSGTVSVVLYAAEDWTSGSNGTFVRIRTTPKGTNDHISRVYVADNGNVGFSNDNPQYRLDVCGSGNFASGLYVNGVPVATGIGATNADLAATGQTLDNKINVLSGFVGGVSGALQAQIAGANGTQTKVTGSTTLTTADFTGIGGTLVFWSGGQVFISGAAGGVGGGVSSLNGLSNAVTIAGTGGLTVSTNGQNILVSGDQSISGALTQTGVTLGGKIDSLSGFVGNVSGGLETRITATGNAVITHANGIGSTLSGNLTTTGQTLYVLVTGMSGQANTNYATVTNLASTGSALYTTLTGMSGQGVIDYATKISLASTGQQAWLAAQNNALNVSGNLTTTGQTLYVLVTGMSGQAVTDYATKTQLTTSGQTLLGLTIGGDINLSGNMTTTGTTLYVLVTGMSGQANTNFATATNLTLTGQTLRALTLGGDTNLSGIVGTTGSNLYVALTGLSGQAVIDYATKAYANGIGTIISGNLTTTGQTLYVLVTGLSGQANLNFATVANLTLTGQTLRALTLGGDTNLSGQLATTGQTLYQMLTGTSGQGVIDYATKTNLTATGQTLFNMNVGVGTNISGNLTQTGVTLMTKINSLSGFTINVSGALQTLIAGGGSVVKVSGSAAIATADFTGIGGAKVFWSGGQVFISGAEGGAGGGVPSVNGITNAVTIAGTGAITTSVQGNTIYVSGESHLPMILNFTAGAVTATNMAVAQTFFAGSAAYITYADLSQFTGVALYINKTATAGAAASRLFLRRKDVYNATATNWTDAITSPEIAYAVNTTNTIIQSGFFPLVDAAKSGVYLALCSQGGDGVLDPAFGIITAQFM